MRHKLFLVFGDEFCKIINNSEISKYPLIKNSIRIYEFLTKEELEAFQKGIDEAIGYDSYQILNDNDISDIMKSANDKE